MAVKKKGGAEKPDTRINPDAPKILESKQTIPVSTLIRDAMNTMDGDFITSKQARAFLTAYTEIVEAHVKAGRKVNLLGLVQIVPRYHTPGTRMVNEEFGNPESKKIKKRYKAKVSLKYKPSLKLKASMPTPARVQKATVK